MKANAPKRKVFNDAVDLLTGGETAAAGKGVQMLPVDGIRPFHNHPFRLYEGSGWMTWWRACGSTAYWFRPSCGRFRAGMRCWQGITV